MGQDRMIQSDRAARDRIGWDGGGERHEVTHCNKDFLL